MKFFVMSCLILLLTVCSVEQSEGYNMQAAICSDECDARFDFCSGSKLTSAKVCDDDYFNCLSEC